MGVPALGLPPIGLLNGLFGADKARGTWSIVTKPGIRAVLHPEVRP